MKERKELGIKEELSEKLLGTLGIIGTIGGLGLMLTSENNVAEFNLGVTASIIGLILLAITDRKIESNLQKLQSN